MTRSSRGQKVLIVTEAGSSWPSGFVRALIYQPLFARDGIPASFASRRNKLGQAAASTLERHLGESVLTRAFGAAVARSAVLNEGAILRRAESAQSIYLQKIGSASLITKLRARTTARIVYDLNDGVWLPVRSAFANGALPSILSMVDAITCDNPIGIEYASQFNSQGYVVPDPPQVESFDRLRSVPLKPRTHVRIGWLGTPGSAFNLFAVWEALEEVAKQRPSIELRLVGTGTDSLRLPRWENIRVTTLPYYSHEQMITEVLQMDVGIFPLFEIEDSLTRGVLKACIYSSGGACVVAQRNRLTSELIDDGITGSLASSREEWIAKLLHVVDDAEHRSRLAAAALVKIRAEYSLQACYEKLLNVLLPEA